jgi:hypothetical protein
MVYPIQTVALGHGPLFCTPLSSPIDVRRRFEVLIFLARPSRDSLFHFSGVLKAPCSHYSSSLSFHSLHCIHLISFRIFNAILPFDLSQIARSVSSLKRYFRRFTILVIYGRLPSPDSTVFKGFVHFSFFRGHHSVFQSQIIVFRRRLSALRADRRSGISISN